MDIYSFTKSIEQSIRKEIEKLDIKSEAKLYLKDKLNITVSREWMNITNCNLCSNTSSTSTVDERKIIKIFQDIKNKELVKTYIKNTIISEFLMIPIEIDIQQLRDFATKISDIIESTSLE